MATNYPVIPESVDSILPRFNWEDENKRTYLSFRVCGFSRLQARQRAKVSNQSVRRWINDDPEFALIEQKNMQELRTAYSKEFIKLDFLHNMKLCLEKDKAILDKSLDTDGRRTGLSKEEWQYLRSIRSLYTAKELNALEGIFNQFDSGSDWDAVVARMLQNGGIIRAKQEITISSAQESVISEEYQEGTVIESGSGWRPQEDDNTEEFVDHDRS